MTYLQTSRKTGRRGPVTVLLAILALVVVVAVTHFFAPHFFPSLATSVVSPFWRMEFSIESGSLKSRESLLAENESLKQKLLEADVNLQTVRALEAENEELKASFGRSATSSHSNRMLAAVLKRPPLAAFDTLIIDIGREDGIADGDSVYAPGNILVGKIIDTLGHTSKVLLFSSPGERYDVTIGSSSLQAVAVGRGGGQYQAELPRDARVLEGDAVSISSISSKPFGIVGAVISDSAEAFQTVLFAPPVNIYQLRWVLVEKNK